MADIGAKISINGAAQFKKDLQNCTQAGKTLTAQMGSLAAGFDNADNKEEQVAKATKILSEQMENQKRKVELLSNAVKESTEKYGENSTETLKLKEQLAKAETQLSKLEGTTAESALGMTNMAESEKDVAKETGNASEKLSAFTVALGQLAADAIKAGFNFMIDSLKSIAGFFVDATKGAAEYADTILELSSTTSMSTDALQEYQYMANLVDTDLSTITGSMTKLTKAMSSAKDGSGATAEAFAALGVSVTDSEGNLRSANDVFDDAITALGSISNETERDALAMSIFGKSAQDLNPLIEAGGDALSSLRQEAHDVGYVLSGETLSDLGEVQDGFDRLGLAADSAKNQIGAAIGQFILPYLNDLVGAVQDLLRTGDVDAFVSSISNVITDLVQALSSALPTILQAGSQIVGNLIMGINDMLPSLVPAAVSLVTEFARFIIENLPAIINTAVEIIIALVNGLAENMPTLIPAAIQMILTIVEGLLSNVGDIIAAALNLIEGLVEGLTSDEGLNSIIDAIPELIMALIDGILNNLDKIIASGINIVVNLVFGLIKAIPKIVQSIPQIISAIVNTFKNFDWSSLGQNIMSNVSAGVKEKASAIIGAVSNAFNAAVSWIKNLASSAASWGRDMISGFANGIMGAANALLDKVRSIAQKIRGFLHFSRPDFGPLRDYEKWMPDFMKGLAKGIDDNAWRVEDAMRGVASDMTLNSGNTTNLGGVSVNVYASPNQDVHSIAREVVNVMTNTFNAKKAVFA